MNFLKMAKKITKLLKDGSKNNLKAVNIKGKGVGFYYDLSSNRFIPVQKQSEMYYLLNRKLNQDFYFITGNFKISYYNPYNKIEDLNYKIYDEDNVNLASSNVVLNQSTNVEELLHGKNVLLVNFQELGLILNKYYVLEIQGAKNPYYLRFKYIEN